MFNSNESCFGIEVYGHPIKKRIMNKEYFTNELVY